MTDTSGIDEGDKPTVAPFPGGAQLPGTPAEAEALQPASNARPLTDAERLQTQVATGVQQQGFGLGALVRTVTTGSPLPALYNSFAEARKAGYSWDELYQAYDANKARYVAQGHTSQEVDAAYGLPSLDQQKAVEGMRAHMPPPSAFEQGAGLQVHVPTNIVQDIAQGFMTSPEKVQSLPSWFAGTLRDFASKYIQPRDPAQAAIDFKPTAGGILSDLGWNVVDAIKIFGHSIFDGAAATAELLDGKKRSAGDYAQLGLESSNFLGLFVGLPEKAGVAKTVEMTLPSKEEFLDGALSHTERNGESLTDNARALGEHFVQTKEDPVSASERFHNDTVAADTFDKQATTARLAREGAPDLFEKYDALAKVRDTYSQMLQNPEFIKQEAAGAGAAQELDALIAQKQQALAGLKGKRLAAAQTELSDLQASREQYLSNTSPEAGATAGEHEAAIRQALQQTDVQMRDLAEQISEATRQGAAKFEAMQSFFGKGPAPEAPALEPGNGGQGALGEFQDHVTGEGFSAMMHDISGIMQSTAAPGRFSRIAADITMPVRVDRTKVVRYGYGLSEDGKTLYVDRDLPDTLDVKRSDGTTAEMDPTKYVTAHEVWERHGIDQLGLKYKAAHEMWGDGAEKTLVENDGWDWKDYNEKILDAIKTRAEPGPARDMPRDIYAKPYIESGEGNLVERHGTGGPHVSGEPVPAEAGSTAGVGEATAAGAVPGETTATVPTGSEAGAEVPRRNLVGEFLSGQEGSVPMLDYSAAIDPQSIRQVPSPLGHGVVDNIIRWINPAARAREAAGIIREGLARSELGLLQLAKTLRAFGRSVGEMPSADRKAWFDAYETGNLGQYEGSFAGDMAAAIHKAFDGLYAQMEKLGVAPEYVENYMPHIWADPDAAKAFFVTRKLEGNKAFTRGRTYELISDGIANGLKLVTDDPVELALLQMQQQQKFIAAHEIRAEMEARGIAAKVTPTMNGKLPDGMARLNIAGGEYFAPEPVATLFNRVTSPGFSGQPAYDIARHVTGLTTSLQLALSVFHPMLLATDAIAGRFGLGITQISRGVLNPLSRIGEIPRGMGTLVTSPLAPFIDAYKGSRYISELINGPGSSPFRTTVADAMIAAGTRVLPKDVYHPTASGSFLRVLGNSFNPKGGGRTLGQETIQMFRDAAPIKIGNTTVAPAYVRAMVQWTSRALSSISSPIMEVAVPHMKIGAIAQEMEDLLRTHPNLGTDDIRRLGGQIVDRVDNRLGELTRDHLFWNKGITDLNDVLFRAPGWVLGKLRLMGSAGLDIAMKGGVMKVEEERELSKNVTYLVGLLAATVFTSSIYGYLKGTWNKDWSWRDYMDPPNKEGTRMSLPSNVRDMYGWLADPTTEGENKFNTVYATVGDLLRNRQYNGAVITDPRQPWLNEVEDYAHFTARQFEPMMFQKPQTEAQQELTPWERALGIRPAPYALREPEKAEGFEQRNLNKAIQKQQRMPQ